MKNKDMRVTKYFERPTCKDCVFLVDDVVIGDLMGFVLPDEGTVRGWCAFQQPRHSADNGLVVVNPDRPFCGNFHRLTEWIWGEQEMEALMAKGNKEG